MVDCELTPFLKSPAAGGFFSENNTASKRWSDDVSFPSADRSPEYPNKTIQNIIGKIYSAAYGKPAVQDSVAVVRNAAAKHGISGHAAAVRWTTFHSILDGQYGDRVIFGCSSMGQLDKTLDALEAGPLPAELADALTAVYPTVEGSEPAYHL